MRYLLLLFVLLLIVFGIVLISHHKDNQETPNENTIKFYQGPVRPTDDEPYFRKTGITRPLEVVNG